MGASNELPESEELDALYDRFLIRRQVAQVSSAQLPTLARLAAGNPLPDMAPPSSDGNGASAAPVDADQLQMDDFRCPYERTVGKLNLLNGRELRVQFVIILSISMFLCYWRYLFVACEERAAIIFMEEFRYSMDAYQSKKMSSIGPHNLWCNKTC